MTYESCRTIYHIANELDRKLTNFTETWLWLTKATELDRILTKFAEACLWLTSVADAGEVDGPGVVGVEVEHGEQQHEHPDQHKDCTRKQIELRLVSLFIRPFQAKKIIISFSRN